MKKFDYIILNEDNECLSVGTNRTQKQLDADIKQVKKEQFDRWGEHYALIVYKVIEKITI